MDVVMTNTRPVPLDEARHAIARIMGGGNESVESRLGTVTLRPHQRTAAARLTSLIASDGGAMLAEPVGLGKTYTALAVAAQLHERTLIAAPASLRDMW